jgi:hypothetical protein
MPWWAWALPGGGVLCAADGDPDDLRDDLSYQVVLPLMLSCVVAYVVRSTDGRSMYEIT